MFLESTEREYKFSIMLPREWTTIILNELNRVQGVLSWLTTIPFLVEIYDLRNQLFWDLIRIKYGRALIRLPSFCECGIKFDLERAFPCKKEGFVSLRHNHVKMSPLHC